MEMEENDNSTTQLWQWMAKGLIWTVCIKYRKKRWIQDLKPVLVSDDVKIASFFIFFNERIEELATILSCDNRIYLHSLLCIKIIKDILIIFNRDSSKFLDRIETSVPILLHLCFAMETLLDFSSLLSPYQIVTRLHCIKVVIGSF